MFFDQIRCAPIVLSALVVTACANANSISRTTLFGKDGSAIHLDAKQRVILTKEGRGNFGEIACAEPGPSALAAYSSSFGVGGTSPTAGAASIAASLAGSSSEGAASIDLRTQTTETLKHTLYRICEMYYNSGLNTQMVMQLHERFQDSTVAIVAIEQLTGATVAQAASIGGTSISSSKAETLRERENELDQLEERDRSLERALKEQKLNEARLVRAARSDQIALRAAIKAKKPADEIEALRQTAEDSKLTADQATQDRELTQKRSSRSKRSLKVAEKAVDKAIAEATSQASATASTSQTAAGGLKVGTGDIKHVADAVQEIVLAMIEKDHTRDSCLTFLSSSNSSIEVSERQSIESFCQRYLSQSNVASLN